MLVAAKGAGDQPRRLLVLIIGAGTEPRLEHMALGFAFEVENAHDSVPSMGRDRRLASAGTRPRTSSMRDRSTSARARPACSHLASPRSPHGSTTQPNGSAPGRERECRSV